MSFFTVTEIETKRKFDINYFHVIGMSELDNGTEIYCRDKFSVKARESIDKVAEMMLQAKRWSKQDEQLEHRIRVDRKKRTF